MVLCKLARCHYDNFMWCNLARCLYGTSMARDARDICHGLYERRSVRDVKVTDAVLARWFLLHLRHRVILQSVHQIPSGRTFVSPSWYGLSVPVDALNSKSPSQVMVVRRTSLPGTPNKSACQVQYLMVWIWRQYHRPPYECRVHNNSKSSRWIVLECGIHIGSVNAMSWLTFQCHGANVKVTASQKLMIWVGMV